MRILRVYRRRTKLLYGLQVLREHIGVLVILGRNVLLDGFGERHRVGPSERQEEDVATHSINEILCDGVEVLTRPWI